MATASGYVVLTTICTSTAAILSLVALASPEWHVVDAGGYHIRRGFFEECQVYSPTRMNCIPIESPEEETFCGHKTELLNHRHGWSATFAIVSCIGWIVAAVLPVAGWCSYSLLTIPAMIINFVSIVFFSISISIFINTYEGWYYCDLDYCSYAQYYLGIGEDCFHTTGYSFTLALLAITAAFLGAFVSALLIRATRAEKIDHQGNAITRESKALAVTLAAMAEHEYRQAQQQNQEKMNETQKQPRSIATKMLPGDVDLDSSLCPPHRGTAWEGGGTLKSVDSIGEDGTNTQFSPAPPPASHLGSSSGTAALLSSLPPSPPPAGGDWVWNPDSRLYWSTSEFLYLDPVQKLYYDPKSSMWYDPVTDQWTE